LTTIIATLLAASAERISMERLSALVSGNNGQ
jgi:hypothetical protein